VSSIIFLYCPSTRRIKLYFCKGAIDADADADASFSNSIQYASFERFLIKIESPIIKMKNLNGFKNNF